MHTYAFAAQAAIVSVNVKTGEVAVDDTVLAVDVGHAINPDTVEGQMHGGMAQAIGWSLMEEEFMKDGKMRNHTFHDYLIPTAMDLPKLRTIIVEHPQLPRALRREGNRRAAHCRRGARPFTMPFATPSA